MGAFAMTYPCFVVLSPSGWPDCMRTDVGMAVCVFTDEHLAERYCRAKRRAIRERTGEDVRNFDLVAFKHAEALLAAFHRAAPSLADKGIGRVAIDPLGRSDATEIVLTEFLADVERSL